MDASLLVSVCNLDFIATTALRQRRMNRSAILEDEDLI